jgi:hypothetical protein
MEGRICGQGTILSFSGGTKENHENTARIAGLLAEI